MKRVLAALLGVFVLTCLYVVLGDSKLAADRDEGGSAPSAGAVEPREVDTPAGEVAAVERSATERSELTGTPGPDELPAVEPLASEAEVWWLLVVDAEDQPQRDVTLGLEDGSSLSTDSDGAAQVPFDPLAESTTAPTQGTALIALGRPLGLDSALDAVWVVAPTQDVRGRVVDLEGAPVSEVDVRVEQRDGLCRLERVLLDTVSFDYANQARSDAFGQFELAALPVHACNRIQLRAEGYAPADVPTTAIRDGWIEATLEPLPPEPEASEAGQQAQTVRVSGLVLDAQGGAVEGATLHWWGRFEGSETPDTDAAGRFALDVPKPTEGQELLAAKHPEHGLVVEPEFGSWVLQSWPDEPGQLVLRFDAEPKTISGRVVDGDGAARAGITVGVYEPTLFSKDWVGTEMTVEGQARAVTNLAGWFKLTDLVDREYTLIAYDDESLLVDRREGVAAGTNDLEWRIGTEAVLPRVEGRVLTRAGTPLVGAEVQVTGTVWIARGEYGSASQSISADGVSTDEEGHFVLQDVPARFARIVVSAPHGLRARPPTVATEDIDPDQPLEIVVPLERPIRIELTGVEAGFARGDYSVVFEDAFGVQHRGSIYSRNGSTTSTRMALDPFSTPVFWSSDEVVQARLFAGWSDDELDAAAVVFGEDGVARVRLRAH